MFLHVIFQYPWLVVVLRFNFFVEIGTETHCSMPFAWVVESPASSGSRYIEKYFEILLAINDSVRPIAAYILEFHDMDHDKECLTVMCP